MAQDFTRVNFGWWTYKNDTMPDIYEYGTSKAASWDCPITLQANPKTFESNPRTADVFEVMSRWEDVRAKKWLTNEQKEMLRDPNREFTLLVNEQGNYELTEYERINLPQGISEDVTAYIFERCGKTCVALWHTKGEGTLTLSLEGEIICKKDFGKAEIEISQKDGKVQLSVADKCYLIAEASKAEILKAFENATLS